MVHRPDLNHYVQDTQKNSGYTFYEEKNVSSSRNNDNGYSSHYHHNGNGVTSINSSSSNQNTSNSYPVYESNDKKRKCDNAQTSYGSNSYLNNSWAPVENRPSRSDRYDNQGTENYSTYQPSYEKKRKYNDNDSHHSNSYSNSYSGANNFAGNQDYTYNSENSNSQSRQISQDKNIATSVTPSNGVCSGSALEFRTKHAIAVFGNDVPDPVTTFKEANLPDEIMQVIHRNKWTAPTPIQAQGWPMARTGMDVVGIAQTGSGKTLTFILPALLYIRRWEELRTKSGPVCIVLVPTRELAQQVALVAGEFGSAVGVNHACVYGGASKWEQIQAIQRGADIVIATPGRLIDLFETGKISFKQTTMVVLDEADRMLDMGFEPQIRKILNQIKPERQTLMWSATWPRNVHKLAKDYLKPYLQVNIGTQELTANHNIKQIVEFVKDENKERKLKTILAGIMSTKDNKTIIFLETKRKCDALARGLQREGYPVDVIHGDKSQEARDWILKKFREGRKPILIATDVASRGLDVNDIKYVVNYDYPKDTEDYVHRIGRTARGGATGTAYTFLTSQNVKHLHRLVAVLKEAKQELSPNIAKIFNLQSTSRMTWHPSWMRELIRD